MKIIKIGAMWCPACIIVNKYYKELKNKYKDIEFIDLDIDLDDEEASVYNVGDILPVFIFFKNDKEIKRVIGEKTQDEIIKEIEGLISEKNN